MTAELRWLLGVSPEQAQRWQRALAEAWDGKVLRAAGTNAGFADPVLQDLYDFLLRAQERSSDRGVMRGLLISYRCRCNRHRACTGRALRVLGGLTWCQCWCHGGANQTLKVPGSRNPETVKVA